MADDTTEPENVDQEASSTSELAYEIETDDSETKALVAAKVEKETKEETVSGMKDGTITESISTNKMLALPDSYKVGHTTWEFVAVPRTDMAKLFNLAWQWPRVILYATLAKSLPTGKPDYTAVLSSFQADNADKTMADVSQELRYMVSMGITENLPTIINTLLIVSPAGTTKEEVTEKFDSLVFADYHILLRAVFDCVGGFPGDLADRFE